MFWRKKHFFIKSKYNVKQKFWETTLDMVLQNGNEDRFASYETTFTLPEGCWISDYYLYVGNKKEKGILAEKKSALWIFKQIRNENRDPGILYYLTGNRISFKVFPFGKNEIRKTGITFIHKEPTVLNIDSNQVVLGDKETKAPRIETTANATYIPSSEKAKLTLAQRKPIYHFIIDVSKDNAQFKKSFVERIENYITRNKIDKNNIKINFTNSYALPVAYSNNWRKKLADHTCEGGYYLGGAIKKTILNSYAQLNNSYPIIIAVTNNIENAIVLNDFADLQFTFPESAFFYELDTQNKIWEHSLINNPLQKFKQINEIDTKSLVFAWPNTSKPIAYLANNNLPSIVMNKKLVKFENREKNNWEAGLQMQVLWRESLINPDRGKDQHLEMIKFSMINQILSPVTSFIVVENVAQKKALKRKQDQILNGNKNLDTDEDTQSMSEPSLVLLLILVALVYTIKQNLLRTVKT
ncbi:MAG: MSEP-CTERM sorting domain-containing protein [Flavobacterium sp.]|nr:MAG: MSEP-CTERM sorting domain-containing protein [Flavobacterium sp.]